MLTKLVLFVCLALAANADEQLWKAFKLKHSKTYLTETEHQLRYAVFTSNLEKIEEHNAKYDQGLVSWYLGINQFADMTPEEFKQTLTAKPLNQSQLKSMQKHVASLQIPQSIDWRDRGIVTAVKNQKACGSCWAFSATGTMEGQYALKTGQLVSFSEQNLMDCCTDAAGYSANGCNGGIVQSGMVYASEHGIATEDSYPYEAKVDTCRHDNSAPVVSGYKNTNWGDENDLKNAVGSIGPISIMVDADKFQLYKGGIFSDTSCPTAINHAILAVGYDNENGQDYWIIKNSWGSDWGEAGYIRMAMGKNLCGLSNQACYATI